MHQETSTRIVAGYTVQPNLREPKQELVKLTPADTTGIIFALQYCNTVIINDEYVYDLPETVADAIDFEMPVSGSVPTISVKGIAEMASVARERLMKEIQRDVNSESERIRKRADNNLTHVTALGNLENRMRELAEAL